VGEFDHIIEEFNASPVAIALKEIGESGDFSRLEADFTKRHHYVSQFVLRGFSNPRDGGRIYQMTTAGRGAPKAIGVRDAAVRKNLYRATDENGVVTNRHEGYLALIESKAAPTIQRLLEAPESMKSGDRATIAFFVAFQIMRTPAAAEQVTEAANMAFRMAATDMYSNKVEFAKNHRQKDGRDLAPDEIEQFRIDMLKAIGDGDVRISGENGAHFAAGFEHAIDNIPPLIAFDWLLLRAPAGGFVTSDRGYAIHDPSPPFPWSAQGILSSPAAETLVPLTDTAALIMRPGTGASRFDVQEIAGEVVQRLNLRTFGWATGYVYARSQATLAKLRVAARRRPDTVIRPKPICSVIGIEIDPTDPTLAQENTARGWPTHVTGSRGQLLDYIVAPGDGPHPELHRRADQLTEQRARRRLGIAPNTEIDGQVVTRPMHPLDVRPA
jgi:hypothetical protein